MWIIVVYVFTVFLCSCGILAESHKKSIITHFCIPNEPQTIILGKIKDGHNSSGVLKYKCLGKGRQCQVSLIPSLSNEGILLNLYKINLQSNCEDKVQISYGDTTDVFGYTISKWFPKNETLSFIFKPGPENIKGCNTFEMTFAAYADAPCIFTEEYQCYIDVCIAKVLMCDGYPQCAYGEDENICGYSPLKISGCVFLFVAAVFLSLLVSLYCTYHVKEPVGTNLFRIHRIGHPGLVSVPTTANFSIDHSKHVCPRNTSPNTVIYNPTYRRNADI